MGCLSSTQAGRQAVCYWLQQILTIRLLLNAAQRAEIKEEVGQLQVGSRGFSPCRLWLCPLSYGSISGRMSPRSWRTPADAPRSRSHHRAPLRIVPAEPRQPQRPNPPSAFRNNPIIPGSDTPVCYLTRRGQRAPRSAGSAPRPGLIMSRNGWIAALIRRSGAS